MEISYPIKELYYKRGINMYRNFIWVFMIGVFLISLPGIVIAQFPPVYPVDTIPIYYKGNKLDHPSLGGFDNPVFSAADLDNDGIEDLLVFEKMEWRFYAFKNNGTKNQIDYTYAPELTEFFPESSEFALLGDYNCDGVADLFVYTPFGGAGIGLYDGYFENNRLKFTFRINRLFDANGGQVYADGTKLPALTDVNGDGDLDILIFEQFDGTIGYYENQVIENQDCDTLIVVKKTNCWGHICECDGFSNSIDLDYNNPICFFNLVGPPGGHNRDTLPNPPPRHIGSTICALDYDKDGSKEILIGDAGFANLTYVLNGGNDSMVAKDSLFPYNSRNINLEVFPAGFYIDVNNDSLNDLIVSSYGVNNCFLNLLLDTTANIDNIWLYENIGSQSRDSFSYVTNRFLVDEMTDVGTRSHPVFFDYNADSLLDLVIGKCFVYGDTGYFIQGLTLYENTGSLSQPEFTWITDNYQNLHGLDFYGMKPAFGDLDDDGDMDMVIGEATGKMHYFENVAGPNNPAQFTHIPSFLDTLQGAQSLTPQIFDIDGDGLLDILAGETQGRVYFYKNVGLKTAPEFKLEDNFFGEVDGRNNEFFGYTVPFFTDIDRDTYPELLLGTYSGKVFLYDELEQAVPDLPFNLVDSSFFDLNWGKFISVNAADLNNDGAMDFVLGTGRGGFRFFSQDIEVGIKGPNERKSLFDIYPNPVSGYLNIKVRELVSLRNVDYVIVDELGRTVKSGSLFFPGNYQINTGSLPNGLYFIKFQNGNAMEIKQFVKY